ncbi:hypothetical protein cyc_04063 [Cyclospora cayetanensis]|uniref:Uncharacterized protein n=1 Tax=Cyclospora cayetanensis TaxID=88456 RepID=A0A1D3D581_9EIME|nr:hypothetical protein cyc_04063 [Cyclospora cayetanensis]
MNATVDDSMCSHAKSPIDVADVRLPWGLAWPATLASVELAFAYARHQHMLALQEYAQRRRQGISGLPPKAIIDCACGPKLELVGEERMGTHEATHNYCILTQLYGIDAPELPIEAIEQSTREHFATSETSLYGGHPLNKGCQILGAATRNPSTASNIAWPIQAKTNRMQDLVDANEEMLHRGMTAVRGGQHLNNIGRD